MFRTAIGSRGARCGESHVAVFFGYKMISSQKETRKKTCWYHQSFAVFQGTLGLVQFAPSIWRGTKTTWNYPPNDGISLSAIASAFFLVDLWCCVSWTFHPEGPAILVQGKPRITSTQDFEKDVSNNWCHSYIYIWYTYICAIYTYMICMIICIYIHNVYNIIVCILDNV